MNAGLLFIHSILRHIVFILLVFTLARHITGWLNKRAYNNIDKKAALFTLITCHVQLLIGIILYFMSNKVQFALANLGTAMTNTELRFWSIEHSLAMLIAIILITIGYTSAKKMKYSYPKYKRISILFGIAFLLICFAIPWPWATIARGWM